MTVFLGDAAEFLQYDYQTGQLSMIDPSAPVKPGVYEIRVIVHDDNSNGERAQEYTITIRVEDNDGNAGPPYILYKGQESDDDGEGGDRKYLEPKI